MSIRQLPHPDEAGSPCQQEAGSNENILLSLEPDLTLPPELAGIPWQRAAPSAAPALTTEQLGAKGSGCGEALVLNDQPNAQGHAPGQACRAEWPCGL